MRTGRYKCVNYASIGLLDGVSHVHILYNGDPNYMRVEIFVMKQNAMRNKYCRENNHIHVI